jgi:tetratricopeptide (TPR) repeat protein
VKASPEASGYTLRQVQQLLGLSRGVVAGLIAAGFVAPARGPRNEYRFGFQDLVLLRTAHSLLRAQVPPRRVLRSLQRLRSSLPSALPLAGLRITAAGDRVAVHGAGGPREVETGQLLLDFEVAPSGHTLALRDLSAPASPASRSAEDWFVHAEAIESDDAHGAQAAYRAALAGDPAHWRAAVNLAALLCERHAADEALAVCDAALVHVPREPLLHFNRAIALEDLGRFDEALASYERCLQIAPQLADAHYNAARLHEQQGNHQRALRHYSAYKRLAR